MVCSIRRPIQTLTAETRLCVRHRSPFDGIPRLLHHIAPWLINRDEVLWHPMHRSQPLGDDDRIPPTH